ncbi:EAL and HDOD domain-containing protein [Noviherbaspirillum aridicola]|uniref:Diguanylate phosphodiesterase n=1 Tax=Noviherbaspirillum aridicola TaxID=2849687 RepID=A0ABQ4Q6A0_9BURK|nr:HDOD domain-containing protein [Noviherbaspirillum aridicola]GIZ52648.1 diguanylate phosphodiesterase [Noviherbaspirillum aridicola]
MQEDNYIVREALVNAQERVVGYRLSWNTTPEGAAVTPDGARQLAAFVVGQMAEDGTAALGASQTVVLDMPASLLADPVCAALPPKSTIIALDASGLSAAGAQEDARGLRAGGTGILLRGFRPDEHAALLPLATHLELDVKAPDFAALVNQVRAMNQPGLTLIARGIDNWRVFAACAQAGMLAFCGNLHLTPRPESGVRELNPAQTLILQLMDMVRKNADVRQLESVLKRDAALSYKLLRYINSAGFGLGCEIQSLRHAVSMLGYSPLYRWLALLLATATTTGYSPVLMQTAVIRGRFSELLGAGFLPKNEAENLFVAGMFSLLDRLLGVPMEDVLEKIQLSESVTQALLAREGIYGPFLALAEACELHDPKLDSMATSLCLGSRHVNESQMAALAWAQNLDI